MHVSHADVQKGFLIVESCVIHSWFSNGCTDVLCICLKNSCVSLKDFVAHVWLCSTCTYSNTCAGIQCFPVDAPALLESILQVRYLRFPVECEWIRLRRFSISTSSLDINGIVFFLKWRPSSGLQVLGDKLRFIVCDARDLSLTLKLECM